jgi:hypothetical protein
MTLSSLRHKFLVLSLLLVLIAATLGAGCTSLDTMIFPPAPTPTPEPTATPAPVPTVTEIITTIPEPTTDPNETIAAVSVAPTGVPVTMLASAAPELLTYKNDTYGFSIDYPPDWQVFEAPVETGQDLGVPRGYSNKVDVVEFYSPGVARCHHGDCVNVQAEMHVEVDPSPPTTALDDYYLKDVTALQRNYPLADTHNTMLRIANASAYRLDYTQNRDLINIHVERVYVEVGGKVFVFTFHAHAPYSGEEDQYAKYSGTVETMFKSFKPVITYKTL